MNIYEKLMTARIKLQNTELKKSGHNKFAGYFYFELGDFLPQVQTILLEIRVCSFIRYSIDSATLTLVNIEIPEEYIEFTSPMSEAALKGCHPVQNLGAVETYIRRYLWTTAMELVEHDALDATVGKGEKESSKSITQSVKETLPEATIRNVERISLDIERLYTDGNIEAVYGLYSSVTEIDEKLALWNYLNSKTRRAIKEYKMASREKNNDGF